MKRAIENKKILLGVTGGISAYKSVYLLRLLKGEGAEVRVVMTEAACEFVAPLTFETLSQNKVHIKMFGGDGEKNVASPVEHIELAKWPDAVIVAPATANTIAKLASGKADDLLSAVICAYAGTVILAPAMNDVMWENPATQENLRILVARGFRTVPPEPGDLACGYEGAGRMAEPESILAFLKNIYASDYSGVRVLVSAGGTEEDLDPVRCISNRSTGKMGFAIAAAARDLGAKVTVVAGRTSIPLPVGVHIVNVRTAEEMSHTLKELFVDSDVLVMAAAVSDYRPRAPLSQKQKGDGWTIELTRTEDILASLGKMKGKRLVIGFALETDDVEKNAIEKLRKKNCDLLVVNNPLEEGAGFEVDTNEVTIYGHSGEVISTGVRSKREIAEAILHAAHDTDAFQKILV
ncbi:MAG: bifunctional phosphopantothenoylcysteine decarboxylase/phosphopantothenate--cysteine ligase CoaBC [Candidatus Latescibacteria bacterium]|nr:bifunctional phosphopantothenoylcysteine decarboxylase/phosphopantothenate--cysteine ligase CoaBC [Candidatus Latescibacterota bacterium]NIM22576.1 bifunctional phosphopantothenoylcysteine decarboxylase/phosphopantothenate--cysteine ligase CoaBC [Candidatus Latescibacterota bacterium]NIM64865.1 bifunctional phosphopantothenoylcysteine decarboxylase/phosphopantothenate--cysteine ligase CoaBC [Candidatus Latescibacterota bacterium]NIO01380.1 bifunctional phosphopantothenoylcysteine decarboxylas